MKDELGGKIIKKLVRLRAKTCSYLKDNDNEGRKQKGYKRSELKKMMIKESNQLIQ